MSLRKLKESVEAIRLTDFNARWKPDEDIPTTAPHVFERDGVLYVSAEHGDDAADYYGEYRGGYPWINPKLEKAATDAGFYWEWENPGCIAAYPE